MNKKTTKPILKEFNNLYHKHLHLFASEQYLSTSERHSLSFLVNDSESIVDVWSKIDEFLETKKLINQDIDFFFNQLNQNENLKPFFFY